MKYKLYSNGKNNVLNIIQEILNNREISDYKTYLNLTDEVLLPYGKLTNIDKAVETFNFHFENKNKIKVLVDEDVDGVTSASSVINYILNMDCNYPVDYLLHNRAKAHGLSDDIILSDLINENIKLLIIPDAASNDIEQCKYLKENGIDIIILDHHEIETKNNYAVIVNNQLDDCYTNKSLSGVGIVYKFLQALDDYYWNDFADNYLDLVALGNIGDMMDIRSFETRHLINKGISNIKNKCFEAFIKAQDYSMNGKINIHNIQWYIVPVINAMIRIGSNEEKDLLFRAFIERDEFFEYKKKATKSSAAEIIQESIYDRAARLSKNAKSRQDKLKEKGVKAIIGKVINECENDKVIIIDGTEEVDNGLTGVVAMKIAEEFNKPCVLLNKHIEKLNTINKDTGKEEVIEKIVYGGSSRNFNNSPIDSLKDIINETNVFDFAQGHQSAFGIRLQINKLDEAREKLNQILKNVVYESVYLVDFILNYNEINVNIINEVDKVKDIIGQGINECTVAIEGIRINKKDIELIGKNNNTISFVINDIKYIQFNCKEGNELYDWINDTWNEDSMVEISVVGKPSINEYGSIKTPQISIVDLVINNRNKDIVEYIEEDVW